MLRFILWHVCMRVDDVEQVISSRGFGFLVVGASKQFVHLTLSSGRNHHNLKPKSEGVLCSASLLQIFELYVRDSGDRHVPQHLPSFNAIPQIQGN